MRLSLPALNVTAPWARLLVSGVKTVETRGYPMPRWYVGRPIWIIETPRKGDPRPARIVGTLVFGKPFRYETEQQFILDVARHRVTTGSEFSWGARRAVWGWPVVLRLGTAKIKLVQGAVSRGRVFTKSVVVSDDRKKE